MRRSIEIIITCISLIILATGCKKDKTELIMPVLYDSIIDVEGNVYKTVLIGNKWWMAENLRVKKFRNGLDIINAQPNSKWTKNQSGYCLYDDNQNAPGLLYNWYAVNDTSKLAPKGWHIASDEEWKELEKYLKMNPEDADRYGWRGSNTAEKLKIESPLHWIIKSDVWSTNESGFKALAGGCRLPDARWGNPGLSASGFWWTTTSYENDNNQAVYRNMDYKNSKVFRSFASKNYGFSIRCIKD
jgi:uncharacterized protein (TIGR02145 family)